MNEDEVMDDYFFTVKANSSENNSKDLIPDAKYYLVRPKDSEIIFVMDKKPDYKEEPFYNNCKECKLDMNNYLEDYCVDQFDTDNMSSEEDSYLYVLGICPPDNSVGYVFAESKEVNADISTVLNTTDNFTVDEEVANHYKIYDWHILALLNNEPFKSYIQEHLDEFKIGESKAPSTPGPTKESKGTPVILNRRLLI
nr:MAG TPA: hypothetical protein [Crassvirales sp.]